MKGRRELGNSLRILSLEKGFPEEEDNKGIIHSFIYLPFIYKYFYTDYISINKTCPCF